MLKKIINFIISIFRSDNNVFYIGSLDKLPEPLSKEDEIKLFYSNEESTNYTTELVENMQRGLSAIEIKPIIYSAPKGVVSVNSISNYNEENSVIASIFQGIKKDTLEILTSSKNAKMELIVMNNSDEEILKVLVKYGISPEAVTLWGTGTPMREFLWSEEMADASVHVLLNVDFKDTYDPSQKEIRNCHINVGTGKEVSIRQAAEMIVKEIGFKGDLRWDSTKPDGTMRKLTDVTKLHNLGWHHKIEIDEGIHRMYEWYLNN